MGCPMDRVLARETPRVTKNGLTGNHFSDEPKDAHPQPPDALAFQWL
jgi:hypothetical protein